MGNLFLFTYNYFVDCINLYMYSCYPPQGFIIREEFARCNNVKKFSVISDFVKTLHYDVKRLYN